MPVGCNNFPAVPTKLTATGAADVAVAAGGYTTALSVGCAGTALATTDVDSVIPVLFGVLVIYLGATAPTAMVIGFATTSGTEIDTYTVDPGQLVNSAKIVVPFHFVGAASRTSWLGAGLTPLIEVNPTGQAVTVKNVGSRAIFALLPGAA